MKAILADLVLTEPRKASQNLTNFTCCECKYKSKDMCIKHGFHTEDTRYCAWGEKDEKERD